MQNGDADIAVHSMKDVPAEMPEGFCLAAMLERANHRDALVAPGDTQFTDLPRRRAGRQFQPAPPGAAENNAARSSHRAACAATSTRDLRNSRTATTTRLFSRPRASNGLSSHHHISQQFQPAEMLPAAAQGVVGVECLAERSGLRAILRQLDHPQTVQTTLAERAIAKSLQANCQSPVAAFAVIENERLDITALVALPDGSESIRDSISGSPHDAEQLGEELASRLLASGARELLDKSVAGHD